MNYTTENMGRWASIFAGLAAIFYLLMIVVTLSELQAMSGLAPFDLRPVGYTAIEADALLARLGDAGRWYYVSRQIPLDMIYPALLAMTIIATLQWVGSQSNLVRYVRFGSWLAMLAAFFDYLENVGIISMILLWPNLPNFVVAAASLASVAKAGLTTAALLFLLGFATVVGWRKWRS